MTLTVGSLFAGIGGFDLGLERAGMRVRWQCEIDPYCQRVLAKHWPHVTRYGDIKTVDWDSVEPVDLLCGGFPCQDISLAGKGAGLAGDRSGLWFEYAKAIAALRPRYVLIENVSALRSRGLDQVLGSLAALGYDAEWHCIPACAVGAPHRRDRVWIIAHSKSDRTQRGIFQQGRTIVGDDGDIQFVAYHAERTRGCRCAADPRGDRESRRTQKPIGGCGGYVAYSEGARLEGTRDVAGADRCRQETGLPGCSGEDVADAGQQQRDRWMHWTCGWEREPQETLLDARGRGREEAWMSIPESLLGRVAYGVPARVDRLRGLGNAIVPQIAEMIGAWILLREEVSV